MSTTLTSFTTCCSGSTQASGTLSAKAPIFDVPVSSHKLKRKQQSSGQEVAGSMQEPKARSEASDSVHCHSCYLIGQPSMMRMARMILECLRLLWSAFSKN